MGSMKQRLGEMDFFTVSEVVLGNPFSAEIRRAQSELRADGAAASALAEVPAWAEWWTRWRELDDETLRLTAYLGVYRDSEGKPADAADKAAERIARLTEAGIPLNPDTAELACRVRATRRKLDTLVGHSQAMDRVRCLGWQAAFGDRLDLTLGLADLVRQTPALIVGEPGTGKELLAQSLLLASPGRFEDGCWHSAETDSVNLAGLPPDLVASTLFGHEKGAFTGSARQRKGLLERCATSAVFLDEVADLPPRAQVGLLRCLQEGKVRRLGADTDVDAKPRILSATHRDLDALVARDRFRVDLYHRLNGVVIDMPPLRERPEDIEPLAEHLVRGQAKADSQQRMLEGLRALLAGRGADHPWPGNVRELIAVLHTLALGIEPRLMTARRPAESLPAGIDGCTWSERDVQSWYAARVMERSPNRAAAARQLGIHRNTLAQRLAGDRS